jgi:cytosine permease
MLTFKVKEEDRQDWGGPALLTAGQLLCIPALMVGGMLGGGLSPAGIAFCTVTGGLILWACACFMGARSVKSGLPSTVISVEGLGVSGAKCISALLISITGIGWFGIQAAICGASFSVMTAETLGLAVPAWAATLFWGLVMTISAINGYQALKFLYYIMVPVLFLVLIFTLVQAVSSPEAGLTVIRNWKPERPISYITGITLVVGDWAMGAFTLGDYCRYGKSLRGTVLSVSITLIVVLPVVFVGGALFSILKGTPDITAILNGLGFPAIALIFLIFASWTLNMMNAYQGGIAVSVLLGHGVKRLKLNTVITGMLGTALGAAGILSRFTEFLSLLSSLVPPVIGVLIGVKLADMLRQRRNTAGVIPGKPAPPGDRLMKSGFYIPGIIAYGAGALIAWLTTAVCLFFIPPLNGIVVAALVYVILDRYLPKKGKRP